MGNMIIFGILPLFLLPTSIAEKENKPFLFNHVPHLHVVCTLYKIWKLMFFK